MEEKKYTVAEVLDMTVKMMREIHIPVELSVTVGIPIAQCIGNLLKCTEALTSAEEEKKEEG